MFFSQEKGPPITQRRSFSRPPALKAKSNTMSTLNKSVRFSASSSKDKDEGFEGLSQRYGCVVLVLVKGFNDTHVFLIQTYDVTNSFLKNTVYL